MEVSNTLGVPLYLYFRVGKIGNGPAGHPRAAAEETPSLKEQPQSQLELIQTISPLQLFEKISIIIVRSPERGI